MGVAHNTLKHFLLAFLRFDDFRLFDLRDRWSHEWQKASNEEHQHEVLSSNNFIAFP